jgi:putative ABC transport system permease protein
MRDVFLSALDAFSTNRRRFLLTVAMLAVGVASLVGIETAVDVLAREVVGSFDKLGAATLLLRPRPDAPPISARQAFEFRHAGSFGVMPGPDRASQAIADVSVWSPLQDAAIVRSGGNATDPVVQLLAVDDSYLAVAGLKLAVGRNFSVYETQQSAAVALLGDNVRRRLFGEGDGLGVMVSTGGRRLQVIGALERQGAVFGTGLDDALLIPVSAGLADCQITLRAAPGELHEAMVEAGSRMASIRRLPPGAEPDFEIVEADSAAATLASLRSKLSLVALAIGLVTMLGAAVGLMNSLLVSVKERTREIGTRRALGARAHDIARQFLSEALGIGLLGSVAGVLLGLLLGNLVALSLDGSFSAPWGWIAAGTLLAAAVSLASGLLPARRAARLDPIEALRSL